MPRQKDKPLSRPQVAPRITLGNTRETKNEEGILTVDSLQSQTQRALDQIARMTQDDGLDGDVYKRMATGTFAERPTPSEKDAGRLYYATDTSKLYRDTGAAWVVLGSLSLDDMTGDVSTSQIENGAVTYIKTNFAGSAFPGSPVTNDLFYRTDRRTLYFWSGSAWKTVGAPSYSNFMANTATTTSCAAGVFTPIIFDSEQWDINGDYASNTFTAPETGIYQFYWSVRVAGMPVGTFIESDISVGGAAGFVTGKDFNGTAASQSLVTNGSICLSLTATNTVRIRVFNSDASARSTSGSSYVWWGGYRIATL